VGLGIGETGSVDATGCVDYDARVLLRRTVRIVAACGSERECQGKKK